MSRGFKLLATLSACLLAGCASDLPSKEGEAFGKVATADKTNFAAAVTQVQLAVRARAVLELGPGRGTIGLENCKALPLMPDPNAPTLAEATKPKPCRMFYKTASDSPKIYMDTDAPKVRKLIGAIADYGDNVTNLAAAKDLTDAQKALDGVAASASAVATAVGQPELVIAIKAATLFHKYELSESRRKLLIEAANQMHPKIIKATAVLSAITTNLSLRIVVAAGANAAADQTTISDMTGAEAAIRQLPDCAASCTVHAAELATIETRREAAAVDLAKAADELAVAQALSADFTSLVRTHQAYIDALHNPGTKAETVLNEASDWTDLISAVATAAK